ncbi:phosphoserine phosphatase SerB [Streptococcus moroccensis]|uniref:phosphoserine phosphatase n=2 Tax=Streptococcus moroccensis TaxID=1451356 RepID=A0ABT9YPG6_9STRE|nr:phosphoserine phosphatase SerB [Streptococcus moroccensis]
MKAFVQKVVNHPFVQYFIKLYQGSDIDLSSIAVAYYFLVAVFPILFMMSSALPFLQINVADVLGFLKTTLPAEVFENVSGIVESILTNPSSGWLGISIATALWTFSQSMIILQKAFNKAYGAEQHRDMIVGRLVGILIGLILQVTIFLVLSVGVFGETIINFIHRFIDIDLEFFQTVLSWTQPVIYGGFIFVIFLLYYILPNVRIKKKRYVIPGTIFVITVLTATTNLVSFYLSQYMNKFENFQLVSYVVLLLVMVWFILIAQVLIIGAILNASFQKLDEPNFTPRRGTIVGVKEKWLMFRRKRENKVRGVKGLLVMDVDSTLIREEAIDILGDLAGVGDQVAAITELAMQGKLDFEEALEERVSLLKGLPETIFDLVVNQITLTKGAKELVDELHSRGYKIGLVSGGFHENVDPIAKELGIDYVKANRLEVRDGVLTGRTEGEIVTKATKVAMLRAWADDNDLDLSETIAMGDGANDLPMIETAGIGIAFNAKPIVRALAPYQINVYDLYQVIPIIEEVKAKNSEND